LILEGTINWTLGIDPEAPSSSSSDNSTSSPNEDDYGSEDSDDNDNDKDVPPPPQPPSPHAIYGIGCSDATLRVSSFAELRAIATKQWSQGSFADVMLTGSSWVCLHWKMFAKEVYEGDFRVKTKNPVMLVNGIYVSLFSGYLLLRNLVGFICGLG
jgi:hypothetical protein